MTAPGAPAPAKVSAKGVWFGLILIVLSIVVVVGGFIVGFVTLAGQADKFTKLQVPGSSTVNLTAGDYGLYRSSSSIASPSQVQITGPSGQKISTSFELTSGDYSSGSKNLSTIGRFTAPESGTYTFTVSETVSSNTSIEVGPTIGSLLGVSFAFIFGGMGLGALLFFIGLIVLIVGLVRRSKAKRANIPPYQGGAPPGVGYAPYQPQPTAYPQAPGGYPQTPAPGGYPQTPPASQPPAPGNYPQAPPAPGNYPQTPPGGPQPPVGPPA